MHDVGSFLAGKWDGFDTRSRSMRDAHRPEGPDRSGILAQQPGCSSMRWPIRGGVWPRRSEVTPLRKDRVVTPGPLLKEP